MNQLAQTAIQNGINVLGRFLLERAVNNNNPREDEITKETIEKIEKLQESIDNLEEQNPKNENNINYEDIEQIHENYSNYAPEMDKEKGCIPCTLSHLLTVSAALEEALRFGREDGIEHEEVQLRIEQSVKELIALERLDLTVEKINNLEDDKAEIIREALNRIRKLRQNLLNDITSLEDLEKETIRANDIYHFIKNTI